MTLPTLPTLSSILLRLHASSTWPQPRPEPGLYAAEWERLGRMRDRAVERRGNYSMPSKGSARRQVRGQMVLGLGSTNPSIHAGLVDSGKKDSERR